MCRSEERFTLIQLNWAKFSLFLFYGGQYLTYSLWNQVLEEKKSSPQIGFEPTTNRLTADRSTTELLRNNEGMIALKTTICE